MRRPVDGSPTPHGAWLYARPTHTHAGVDLGAREGVEVVAPCDGVVEVVDREGKAGSGWHGYAPVVVLRSSLGNLQLWHVLAHLRGIEVHPGDALKEGTRVGVVGPERHVHWEVRRKLLPAYSRGQRPHQISVDPLSLLRGEIRPFTGPTGLTTSQQNNGGKNG